MIVVVLVTATVLVMVVAQVEVAAASLYTRAPIYLNILLYDEKLHVTLLFDLAPKLLKSTLHFLEALSNPSRSVTQTD